jgi:ribosomal protein S20
MKKSELREFIRQCIREVLAEETDTPKEDPTLKSLQKKVDDLAKVTKKVPDELKSKLAKKIKTAQADIDSYKDSLKSDKTDDK